MPRRARPPRPGREVLVRIEVRRVVELFSDYVGHQVPEKVPDLGTTERLSQFLCEIDREKTRSIRDRAAVQSESVPVPATTPSIPPPPSIPPLFWPELLDGQNVGRVRSCKGAIRLSSTMKGFGAASVQDIVRSAPRISTLRHGDDARTSRPGSLVNEIGTITIQQDVGRTREDEPIVVVHPDDVSTLIRALEDARRKTQRASEEEREEVTVPAFVYPRRPVSFTSTSLQADPPKALRKP